MTSYSNIYDGMELDYRRNYLTLQDYTISESLQLKTNFADTRERESRDQSTTITTNTSFNVQTISQPCRLKYIFSIIYYDTKTDFIKKHPYRL